LDIPSAVSRVDGEKIYQHVSKLEGSRHPIDSPERLNEAADYILSEFKQYGLAVNEQKFKVEACDDTFRNVEGVIRGIAGPELLIVSHYDTVQDCPGADDNASAVAVMLESAQVLSKEEGLHNIRFVSFTLEEQNPARELMVRKIAQNLGLTDLRGRYTNMRTQQVMKKLGALRERHSAMGKNPAEALAEALAEARSQLEKQMNEAEVKYVKELEKMYEGVITGFLPGKTGCMGSAFWVEEALRTNKQVSGVLCSDTIGYTSSKEHSQALPRGLNPQMLQTHAATDVTVGNFLAVISDANSGRLAQSFCDQSKLDSIDLPYACLQLPFRHEDIARNMHDLARSDHAPFWRAGIPALFLTDSGDFRYPYYHTQADTIDKLDFDFITRVCKATVATAIDLTRTSIGH
jgi:hypothetical protein